MGLDMMLLAETPQAIDGTLPVTKGTYKEVAYWRKANHIHGWFVKNIQDGIDECQKSAVSRPQLEELRQLCMKVLDTKDPTPLAPKGGFFFGATDIDDWYWSDLRDTIDQLDKVLDLPEQMQVYYQASW